MKNVSRIIETIANVAIILVAIVLGIVSVKRYVITSPPRNIESFTSANQPSSHQKIDLPGVDWSKKDKTLVLAISSACHFCTESAPFYRRLAEGHEGAQLVAVLPQPVQEGRQYLGIGFEVDEIVQAPLNSIYVSGTPTRLLVNRTGDVMGTWVGRLPADQEAEVLTQLKAVGVNN